MTNDFEGKTALITGAGKGRGRALAEEFAKRGARVAVNDISPVNLDGLVAQSGGRIKAYVDDVAKKVAAQSIVNQVEDDFGRIDILINHAGVEPRVPFLDMDEWDWHRVLDVNLTGAFLMMQSVGRVMRARGAGVMINLISARPLEVGNEAAYRVSVAGLIALTRSAADELSPLGIRVHAVGTGMAEFHRADGFVPSDLIGAVMFLCHSSLNGQIVNVEEK
jgi:NAD(P)-dependent dehydrogenase (short-subunit alcohol dehydrogenase family)